MIQEKCEKKCKNVATFPYQAERNASPYHGDTDRPKRKTATKNKTLFFPTYAKEGETLVPDILAILVRNIQFLYTTSNGSPLKVGKTEHS